MADDTFCMVKEGYFQKNLKKVNFFENFGIKIHVSNVLYNRTNTLPLPTNKAGDRQDVLFPAFLFSPD